jgi:hypothetical protein
LRYDDLRGGDCLSYVTLRMVGHVYQQAANRRRKLFLPNLSYLVEPGRLESFDSRPTGCQRGSEFRE